MATEASPSSIFIIDFHSFLMHVSLRETTSSFSIFLLAVALGISWAKLFTYLFPLHGHQVHPFSDRDVKFQPHLIVP